MLRIIASTNAASAAAYFNEGLSKEDYYSQGQEVIGRWHGRAAEELGLSGQVQPEQFMDLVFNRNPSTGEKLTPRNNTEQNRIPGWDFNFHAVKSLSVLQGLKNDDAMVRVFREAVAATMADIEELVSTRVRRDGLQEDRLTSNFVWAEYVHFTARGVKGKMPDPHLHVHAYVFNATKDEVEERWKAAKIHDIKSNAPFFESLFHSRLAKSLADLGYVIRRTRNRWEIAGLDKPLLDKNSQRTLQIEAEAIKRGITDAEEKSKLGAKTRGKKQKDISHEHLLADWHARLTSEERAAVERVYRKQYAPPKSFRVTTEQAVAFAEKKLFEKNSVVSRASFYTEALKFGVGYVTFDHIKDEMKRRGFIERHVGGDDLVTTPACVVEETSLIQRVRDGRGKMAPLHPGKRLRYGRDFLSVEQKEVIRHIMKSNSQVIGLRGRAGTGKTTCLQEVRDLIQEQGKKIFAFAPSAEATEVLRGEGFHAETVARLIVDERLQQQVRGQVILVDEAGLLGILDLVKIMDIAGDDTRILLVGDTGQHAPVARADAMRLIETYAGLEIATLREIRRQQKEGYKQAVEFLAEQNLQAGFAKLEEIHAMVEIPDAESRYDRIAQDYVRYLDDMGEAPVVVSPTHAEGSAVTVAIREALRGRGKLGADDRAFLQYHDLRWEDAEKGRPENYEAGNLTVQFHQNSSGGIKRGSLFQVAGVDDAGTVWLARPDGTKLALDLKQAEKFKVYETREILLTKGDLLMFTQGGKSANGHRLNTGTKGTIQKIGKDGKITLTNGFVIDPNHGHFRHGYCTTSHSAQGKTAPEVFIAQSAASFRAGSMEQFYVSVSRGKHRVRIYTDDKTALQKAVGNSSRRLSALEFTGLGEEFFMSEGLSGSEWAKRIANDRGRRMAKAESHVQKLLAERKISPKQEMPSSFAAYVESRRMNPQGGGKSRGVDPPQLGKPKRQGMTGVIDHRRSGLREGEKEARAKAAAEKKAGKEQKPEKKQVEKKPETLRESRIKRVGKAFEGMKQRLNETVKRTQKEPKIAKDSAGKTLNFGNVKTTLSKLNNKATEKKKVERKATQKPTQPPKPKLPPPPVMRRR
jgi:conjugative relaxase-like TrwC/TraI family protein